MNSGTIRGKNDIRINEVHDQQGETSQTNNQESSPINVKVGIYCCNCGISRRIKPELQLFTLLYM